MRTEQFYDAYLQSKNYLSTSFFRLTHLLIQYVSFTASIQLSLKLHTCTIYFFHLKTTSHLCPLYYNKYMQTVLMSYFFMEWSNWI